MNKKKKQKKQVKKQVEQQKVKPKRKNWATVLGYNVLSFFLLLLLFKGLVSKNNGYDWMWNTLINENLKSIKEYNHLTTAQKHEVKQGFFFNYLSMINENTPEDAIILIPSDSVINSVDAKYKLKTLGDRRKTTYFIYPRRAVYEKDMKQDSIYLDKVTHIAIVNYFGYEKLNYDFGEKQQFAVVPITLNNQKK